MKKLSILMPSLLHRVESSEMYQQIQGQVAAVSPWVEFLCLMDNGPLSTGRKVGLLLDLCSGDYISHVGDDDKIEPDFVSTLLHAISDNDVDVITFDHSYSVDGSLVAITKQTPGCNERETPRVAGSDHKIHHRLPGPLCPVRSEIAKRFEPPNKSEKEDWAYKQFLKAEAKTSYNIDRVLYHHMWKSHNKKERDGLRRAWRRR